MNKYKVTSKQGIHLYSNLINVHLSNLYHEKHERNLPHPADILSEKIEKLERIYKKVVFNKTDSTPSFIKPLTDVKDFILSIDEFYDGLPLIIKCFTPPSQTDDNKDVSRWLKSQKSSQYISLLDGTSALHSDFKNMANRLKHDHADIVNFSLINHNRVTVNGLALD